MLPRLLHVVAAHACYECLLPFESGETVDIQGENADRDEIFEDGLHPALDLQSLACISFFYEVVPAPSELVAAEY